MNNIFTERMNAVQEKMIEFANCLDRLNDEDTIFKKLVHFHLNGQTNYQRLHTFHAVAACLTADEQASVREKIQYTVTDSILHYLKERGYDKEEIKVIYGHITFIDSTFLIQYKGKELFLFSLSDLNYIDGKWNYSRDFMDDWDKESYYQKKVDSTKFKIRVLKCKMENASTKKELGSGILENQLNSLNQELYQYQENIKAFEENKKKIKKDCERFVKDMWRYLELRKVVQSH